MVMNYRPYISRDPAICGGEPVLPGPRRYSDSAGRKALTANGYSGHALYKRSHQRS